MNDTKRIKSDIYLNEEVLKICNELINIMYNDCTDIYGNFDRDLFCSLSELYKKSAKPLQ